MARSDGEPVEDPLEREVRRAWASLLDRADAIADDISLTLLEKGGQWYDLAGEHMRSELRASTRTHVSRGIRAMAGLAHDGERTTDVWRETGRRRARQGVPLELVLNAYTLGTRVLWESLLEEGRRHDRRLDGQVMLLAGQQVWNALDVQNAVLVEAYRRESARLERQGLQRQHSVLDGLVGGRGSDPEFAREAAQTLGVRPDEPIACVVAPVDEALDEPLRAPEDHLERAGTVSHWHVHGGCFYGLVQLGGRSLDDLLALLTPVAAGRVGVALAADGLAGFASAYQLALRAAQTVRRGATQVAAVNDRLPEVLLAGSPEVAALLVEESVGPLLALGAGPDAVLLDTLLALLEHNGSPTHAAAALYCHRNTVIYRQRRIQQLTGRDLQVPRDRLLLALGLMVSGRTSGRTAALVPP